MKVLEDEPDRNQGVGGITLLEAPLVSRVDVAGFILSRFIGSELLYSLSWQPLPTLAGLMSSHIHVFNDGTGLVPKSLTPHCALDLDRCEKSVVVWRSSTSMCAPKVKPVLQATVYTIHPFEHFY